jgi:phosphoserine phosphatase
MTNPGKRVAFFDVDNTIIRGSTIFFLGRGMYQRGFFSKRDISAFVLANLKYRLTGTEKAEEIEKFQMPQPILLVVIMLKRLRQSDLKFMMSTSHLHFGKEQLISQISILQMVKKCGLLRLHPKIWQF